MVNISVRKYFALYSLTSLPYYSSKGKRDEEIEVWREGKRRQ